MAWLAGKFTGAVDLRTNPRFDSYYFSVIRLTICVHSGTWCAVKKSKSDVLGASFVAKWRGCDEAARARTLTLPPTSAAVKSPHLPVRPPLPFARHRRCGRTLHIHQIAKCLLMCSHISCAGRNAFVPHMALRRAMPFCVIDLSRVSLNLFQASLAIVDLRPPFLLV